MGNNKSKKRFLSIITTLALTTQVVSFSHPVTYAKTVESQSETSSREEVNDENIITNGMEGTYYSDAEFSDHLLIRLEDSNATFDINRLNIPKPLLSKMKNIHSIKWEGIIEPSFSEEYTFTTSDNDHIKLWIDDELIINGQNIEPQAINLASDQQYKITIGYSNPDVALSELEIKWSSKNQEEEIIPKEQILPPTQSEEGNDSLDPVDLIVDEPTIQEEAGEESTDLAEEAGEESTDPAEEAGEGSTDPAEEAGEESTDPAEEEGEESTDPAEEAGEESTDPVEEPGDESSDPGEEAGEESTDPAEEAGEEPTDPVEEPGDESPDPGEEAGEESTDPVEEPGDESPDPGEEPVDNLTDSLGKAAKSFRDWLLSSYQKIKGLITFNPSVVSAEVIENDTDDDGVTDLWEINGYTHIPGFGLVEWDDAYYEMGVLKYTTSPYDWSTDQDPYSDKEEVTGQIDAAILAPATHPLVPAFPDIKADLEHIQVTPRETITLSDGTSKSTGWQTQTDTTESKKISTGAKFGTEVTQEFEVSASLTDLGVKQSTSLKLYTELNTNIETTDVTSNSSGRNGTNTANWSQATTSEKDKAATSIWNVKYRNVGTAPAYDIVPSLSLTVGNLDILSLKTANASTIGTIVPNGTYPSSGSIALQYQEVGSVDNTPIYLTIDQLKMIEMGLPISLSTDQIEAKVKRIENGLPSTEYNWSLYEGAIDAVSANITFISSTTGEHNYKIYANDPNNSNSQFKPDTSLEEALVLVLDAEIVNEKLRIFGEEVDDSWRVYFSSDSSADYDAFQQGESIFDTKLRPGMNIVIEKPDPNGTPYVQYALYADEGKQVVANVLENGSSIESVKATVKTINNGVQELILTDEDENGDFDGVWESDSSAGLIDLTHADAKITVTAANGNETESYILRPYDLSLYGLGYVPLQETQDVSNINTLSSQYPTAEAFVLEVKDTETTSNKHNVQIGAQETYLGVNDDPIEYRGAATTYQLYEDADYEGDRIYDLTSSMSDLRSGFHYMSNDSGSNKVSGVKLRQDESGSGLVLYNYYGYENGNVDNVLPVVNGYRDLSSTNMDNKASSVRIVGQSGKPFVRLYDQKDFSNGGNDYAGDFIDIYGQKDISGYFNNKASSFKVFAGEDTSYQLDTYFYNDGDFSESGGWYHSWDTIGRGKNLTKYDTNNNVSSIKLGCEQNCPTVKFYNNKNYDDLHGNNTLTPIFDLRPFGMGSSLSSIKFENNEDKLAKVIIYKETDFEGSYAIIDESIPDLSSFQDIIYKGRSATGSRGFNNTIDSARFYYGPVYRFYEGTNYTGDYADYVIGEDDIGSNWSNQFSSVKVFNPLPEIGLIAYDNTNYAGDFLPVTKDIPDLSRVDFNDKISSVKLITRIPDERPTHNSTVVVPASDLTLSTTNDYFGEGTSIKVVGYFDRLSSSSKFTPYNHERTYTTTGTQSYSTGINHAKGYLVQVDANRVTSNKVRVKINGSSYSELGTSATHALGFEPGAENNPKHSNIVFVPADENDPANITVDISLGSWKDTDDNTEFSIKVLGYFADENDSNNDWFYDQYTTPISVASPTVTDEQSTQVILQGNDFKEQPKAFLVNVTAKNIGASVLKFSINNDYIQLGTAATKFAKGVDPESVHHSGLMYVTADELNPYLLTMTPDYGTWTVLDSNAEYDIDIVGYFY
ncbi:binary toxin-like calcium binding domain-containing protein [Bacillus sp. SM2101]|uniref:binary toxin-like calcium binding domain-containing protein n=1 Tax=Bacillus sp. SM2101 TaxID=2805366 RepID=UPI001BDF176E|nr:binary toxin-like calcium binding domain-containing protein [Bacillus sp. SM2101]